MQDLSDTEWLRNVTREELEELLIQAANSIKDLNNDLTDAALAGQRLAEENTILWNRLAPKTPPTSSRARHSRPRRSPSTLSQANYSLQIRIHQLESDQDEQGKLQKREQRKLEKQVKSLQLEIDRLEARNEELELELVSEEPEVHVYQPLALPDIPERQLTSTVSSPANSDVDEPIYAPPDCPASLPPTCTIEPHKPDILNDISSDSVLCSFLAFDAETILVEADVQSVLQQIQSLALNNTPLSDPNKMLLTQLRVALDKVIEPALITPSSSISILDLDSPSRSRRRERLSAKNSYSPLKSPTRHIGRYPSSRNLSPNFIKAALRRLQTKSTESLKSASDLASPVPNLRMGQSLESLREEPMQGSSLAAELGSESMSWEVDEDELFATDQSWTRPDKSWGLGLGLPHSSTTLFEDSNTTVQIDRQDTATPIASRVVPSIKLHIPSPTTATYDYDNIHRMVDKVVPSWEDDSPASDTSSLFSQFQRRIRKGLSLPTLPNVHRVSSLSSEPNSAGEKSEDIFMTSGRAGTEMRAFELRKVTRGGLVTPVEEYTKETYTTAAESMSFSSARIDSSDKLTTVNWSKQRKRRKAYRVERTRGAIPNMRKAVFSNTEDGDVESCNESVESGSDEWTDITPMKSADYYPSALRARYAPMMVLSRAKYKAWEEMICFMVGVQWCLFIVLAVGWALWVGPNQSVGRVAGQKRFSNRS